MSDGSRHRDLHFTNCLAVLRSLDPMAQVSDELIRAPHCSIDEMRTAFGWDLDRYIYFGGYLGAPLFHDEFRTERIKLGAGGTAPNPRRYGAMSIRRKAGRTVSRSSLHFLPAASAAAPGESAWLIRRQSRPDRTSRAGPQRGYQYCQWNPPRL